MSRPKWKGHHHGHEQRTQITIVNGQIQQSNFQYYSLLSMQEVHESIETAFIPSSEKPEGVGETATPMVAGTIINAFLKLTG